MKYTKEIYNNGTSAGTVEYVDGLVRIVQTINDEISGEILLYLDEIRDIVNFVEQSKNA